MSTPKVIKTEDAYESALARIEEIFDAKPGTPEFDEMELLIALVEKYEDANYSIEAPDPISAIKFRMEQQGLKNKDLIPFIGSKSKVSEVLSGKRELSINMIRKLHEGLGIPAEVLIQDTKKTEPLSEVMEHGINFPFTEMFNRGWFNDFFDGTLAEAKKQKELIFAHFIAKINVKQTIIKIKLDYNA